MPGYKAPNRKRNQLTTPMNNTSGNKTPLNSKTDKRTFSTSSETKGQIEAKGKSSNVPPGGRSASGYSESVTAGGMQISNEGGRFYKGKEAKGRVEKKTNHPNKALNKLYG